MEDIKFGTGGFRGIIEKSFTKENIKRIGDAILLLIDVKGYKKEISIGYDFRKYSKEYSTYLACILSSNNVKVYFSNSPTPTPAVIENVKRYNLDLGVMFTASHNPAIYNGVKLFTKEGFDADATFTNELENLLDKNNTNKLINFDLLVSEKKIIVKDFLFEYLDFIKQFININSNNNIKVLFDPIYGTSLLSLPPLFDYYNINYKTINNQIDSSFNNILPNPTYEHLTNNRLLLLDEHFDLCVGCDSDGDRLGILDEKGNYIDANLILGGLYYYLVKIRGLKGDIVKNIATSNLIDMLAEKFGYVCHTVDVGFKNISNMLVKTNSLIGGESSGGLTIRGYLFGKDSTFSTLLLIEALINTNKKASVFFNEVKNLVSYEMKYIEKSLEVNNILNIKNKLFNTPSIINIDYERFEILNDNIKYHLMNNEWILIRFSGTEPIIRLVFELNKNIENENIIINIINKIKGIDK